MKECSDIYIMETVLWDNNSLVLAIPTMTAVALAKEEVSWGS